MLRKMRELKGFAIGAKDGDIGEVNDFDFDDKNWTVRYLAADSQRWLPRRKVFISPQWIAHVDWKNSNLYVNLSGHAIKSGPVYDPEKLILAYEAKLDGHYGEPSYWWC